jgi:hypothetical protein
MLWTLFSNCERDWERLTALVRDSALASFTRFGPLSPESAATMQAWPSKKIPLPVRQICPARVS